MGTLIPNYLKYTQKYFSNYNCLKMRHIELSYKFNNCAYITVYQQVIMNICTILTQNIAKKSFDKVLDFSILFPLFCRR